MCLDFQVKAPFIQSTATMVTNWSVVIAAFAMGLGAVGLTNLHLRNIQRKQKSWYNSVILLVSMYGLAIIGILKGPKDPLYDWIFTNILTPLSAIVYASIAFYITSAAYRAFRARSLEAAVLLASGFIVLLGVAPIGASISPWFPKATAWIINVANVAGMRGIIICSAVGAVASALRILTGIERGHLGSGA
jgi:hypothetical protein